VLLGASASEVLLVSALDGLALGELLAGTLVGLADGEAVAGKSLALLGEVGEVLLVGLGVVLLLGLGGGGDLRLGVASGVLNLGGGNVGASLLVRPLGLALYLAPAVTGLLLVLANASVAVTVVAGGPSGAVAVSTTASTAAATTATSVGVTGLAGATVTAGTILAPLGAGVGGSRNWPAAALGSAPGLRFPVRWTGLSMTLTGGSGSLLGSSSRSLPRSS